MNLALSVTCTLAVACWPAIAQSRVASPEFEVASIRRTAAENQSGGTFGCGGGPGSKTPTRWTCHGVSVSVLIGAAYDLKPYQMTNSVLATGNAGRQFDIEAVVPEGATEQAFRQMQIELLKTRFSLILHFEDKQVAGFDLTVVRDKLKPASRATGPRAVSAEPVFPGQPVIDKDGFPTIVNSHRTFLVMMNGRARWVAWNKPIYALIELLEQQLRQPVIDSTGLVGQYDFVLKWGTHARRIDDTNSVDSIETDDAPSLLTAVQDQLGLMLIPKRVRIPVPVVDHIEKNPTSNY